MLEKAFLAAGLIASAIYIMSNFVVPVLADVGSLDPVDVLARLLLPTVAILLHLFFIVFECVLNGFAELTRFADRRFYDSWWSSTTYAEFSRSWNVPVHAFLLRHVYLDSQSGLGLPPAAAIAVTFLVSIAAHEAVLWAALRLRAGWVPWLALFSLSQFPLASLMRAPAIKGRRLGNLLFWTGICGGVAVLWTLYARELAAAAADAPDDAARA